MSRAVHRGPAEDHVRALLRLVCVATALGAASGASHASMTDSSSSFEAARRPSLRLGFVDDGVDPAALRAVHADKVGGRPRWPCAPPLELHAPPCPACGGATQCQKAGDIITMGTRRLQRLSTDTEQLDDARRDDTRRRN